MLITDLLKVKGNTIHSVASDAHFSDAVDLMVSHDIGSVVVMEDHVMVGLLTFREVLKAFNEHGGRAQQLPVENFMLRDPVVAHPEDSIDKMRNVMADRHVRYVPVRENGSLLGVISFHDVAKVSLSIASFENRLLKRYIRTGQETS
jgi:CBS domain-containing protein